MKTIELTKGKFAIVDDEDFEWLNKFNWYCQEKIHKSRSVYYATRKSTDGKFDIGMHRSILGLHKGDSFLSDHIDGNGLNNQRFNLRMSTKEQNQHNRAKFRGNSKYLGVCWHKTNRKWMACLKGTDGKRKYAYFKTEIEAAKKRDEWAKELHGEFAKLNFPLN